MNFFKTLQYGTYQIYQIVVYKMKLGMKHYIFYLGNETFEIFFVIKSYTPNNTSIFLLLKENTKLIIKWIENWRFT